MELILKLIDLLSNWSIKYELIRISNLEIN